MELAFEVHVALRYLLAKRKQAFISVISAISTLGVTVGVMALVIALALMTGLQQELRDRIVGSNPHIYVWNSRGIQDYHAEAATLRKVPHVLGAAPAIMGEGLITARGETQLTIRVRTDKVPDGFRMIVPVLLDFGDGSTASVPVNVQGPIIESVFPPLPRKPQSVVFNPFESVLAAARYFGGSPEGESLPDDRSWPGNRDQTRTRRADVGEG